MFILPRHWQRALWEIWDGKLNQCVSCLWSQSAVLLVHTNTRTHARARAHTHTHTHTHPNNVTLGATHCPNLQFRRLILSWTLYSAIKLLPFINCWLWVTASVRGAYSNRRQTEKGLRPLDELAMNHLSSGSQVKNDRFLKEWGSAALIFLFVGNFYTEQWWWADCNRWHSPYHACGILIANVVLLYHLLGMVSSYRLCVVSSHWQWVQTQTKRHSADSCE